MARSARPFAAAPTAHPYRQYYLDDGCGPGDYHEQLSHILLANSRYNCGNRGIVLASFDIDGAGTPKLAVPAVTIALSAVEDTHVWRLRITNAPQDAIFLRNGGVASSVSHNVIAGWNQKHHNGAAINVEMWSNGHIGDGTDPQPSARPPVMILDNTLLSSPGPAAQVEVAAINVNRPDPQASPPRVHIQGNHIELSDRQSGIGCFDCVDSMIAGNFVTNRLLQGSSPWFTGIVVSGERLGVVDNEVLGGGIHDHGRGILISASDRIDIENSAIRVQGNAIANKNGRDPATGLPYFPALEVRGIEHFTVADNTIGNVTGAPGLVVGYCPTNIPETADGLIGNNDVAVSGPYRAYAVHRARNVWLLHNLDGGQPLADADVLSYCPPFEHVVVP